MRRGSDLELARRPARYAALVRSLFSDRPPRQRARYKIRRTIAPSIDAMKPAGSPSPYQPMARPKKPAMIDPRNTDQYRDDDAPWIAARHIELCQNSHEQPDENHPHHTIHLFLRVPEQLCVRRRASNLKRGKTEDAPLFRDVLYRTGQEPRNIAYRASSLRSSRSRYSVSSASQGPRVCLVLIRMVTRHCRPQGLPQGFVGLETHLLRISGGRIVEDHVSANLLNLLRVIILIAVC